MPLTAALPHLRTRREIYLDQFALRVCSARHAFASVK